MVLEAGETASSEVKEFRDPETNRLVRQLTAGDGNEYHLYYQTYAASLGGRWLAFSGRRGQSLGEGRPMVREAKAWGRRFPGCGPSTLRTAPSVRLGASSLGGNLSPVS